MQGTSASCINEQSHEAVLCRADTLLKQQRSNPSATTIKNSRRRRKHVGKARDYQRNIVIVDYADAKPPAVQVLHDYDKCTRELYSSIVVPYFLVIRRIPLISAYSLLRACYFVGLSTRY